KYLNEAAGAFGDKAEVLIAQHNWPVFGGERVQDFLSKQRDLYKHVHDQTLRLLNQGFTASEIARTDRIAGRSRKRMGEPRLLRNRSPQRPMILVFSGSQAKNISYPTDHRQKIFRTLPQMAWGGEFFSSDIMWWLGDWAQLILHQL